MLEDVFFFTKERINMKLRFKQECTDKNTYVLYRVVAIYNIMNY